MEREVGRSLESSAEKTVETAGSEVSARMAGVVVEVNGLFARNDECEVLRAGEARED